MTLTKQRRTLDSYIKIKRHGDDPETKKLIRVAHDRFSIFCQEEMNQNIEDLIDEMKISMAEDAEDTCVILQQALNWLGGHHTVKRTSSPNGAEVKIHYSERSLRTWFTNLKGYLYYRGVKLHDMDIHNNIKFPKAPKEIPYALTKSNIDKIIDNSTIAQKNFYLALISSGMRDGEALQIRKEHLNFDGERVRIEIPPSIAKYGIGRITFLSFEAYGPIRERVEKLEPDMKVWGSDNALPNNDQREKIRKFEELVDRIGLGKRYESTKRRNITLHTFRSWFISKGNKVEDGLGHALAGHGKYMKQYERYSLQELEELYVNSLERFVIVYDKNLASKKIDELERKNQTIVNIQAKLDELWADKQRMENQKS